MKKESKIDKLETTNNKNEEKSIKKKTTRCMVSKCVYSNFRT